VPITTQWRGVLETTLCDKVCHCLAACQLFSPDTLYSSTNNTDRYDITEMLLKVASNAKTILMSTNACFFLLRYLDGLAILFMNGIPELFILIPTSM